MRLFLTNQRQLTVYSYTGNRLNQITGGPLATNAYSYDANGNVTTGRDNKTFTYNILNLPNTVNGGANPITYTYNAAGQKLKKQSYATTDYVNGIQYNNGVIDFIQTEEGIARRNGGSYRYEYNLKDHLGDVRATFYKNPTTGNLEVLQRDDYYAFGKDKSILAYNNKYLYNGKELQDELDQYDYGWRFYDPVIGRWTTVDPSAEDGDQESLTPYQYGLNNPVKNTDPDGRCPSCIIGGIIGGLVDYGEQVTTNYIQGNKNPWTSNINLVSIGTAALAGAATSGASVVENLTAKTVLKVGAKVLPTVINNVVEVNTTDGVKVHNATDVVKNSVIDFAADGLAGKVGGKVEGALSKVGVTNAGRLSSTSKAVVKALGGNVTRATTATVKAGLKTATKVVTQTTESAIKAATNQKRDELKKNTNTGN